MFCILSKLFRVSTTLNMFPQKMSQKKKRHSTVSAAQAIKARWSGTSMRFAIVSEAVR